VASLVVAAAPLKGDIGAREPVFDAPALAGRPTRTAAFKD